ncbi:hypothetical protein PTTG_28470 [Puccinia triticina 1-1 BBBD Race 1]|uniref:NADH-cytochrome b5 reductase n=2 Tax=Puccinia triticina TaxID=208348 RepID=A0A180GBG7_PUCT1|nr:uncharacterized protein PtA15_17A306 [Puccinia triticina]OAV90025.1 hypothetical protein PTTG_28470 [Puccinia triticina 1-1 BBBD Race 1]WAQ92824.1 hypothetical protein PtA15_17A306 [Puccinia triticina]WAR63721.1 hypothetical protein PtB15_17B322 [Puccinia triticina]
MVLRLIQSPVIRHTLSRAYSTPAPSPNSLPLKQILLGGLAAGAGILTYASMGGSPSGVEKVEESSTKPVTASALSPKEWRNFQLKQVIPYNQNTSTFIFELPKGTDSGLHVASCLITKSVAREGPMACNDDKGKPVIRPYTPITPPKQTDTLHLMVKNYNEGKMTNHIFSLSPGDQLAMKGPFPKWLYKPNEFKTIGMIAGGSGITPHWQIIQEIASNPQDKTKVVLLFANQKEEDILLRKEFERLAKEKPHQFSINFALDQPPKNWPSELKGYLTKDVLKSKLPSPALGSDVKIFVCGPPGQVAAVAGPKNDMEQGELKGMLKDLGFTEDQVYKF